jgi:hypothetical protein
MKIRNAVAITCFVSLALIVAGVLVTAATPAKGKPASETLRNGPKGIPPGWEKVVFVHYRKNAPARPTEHPGKKPKPPTEDADCYTFLRRGVKWQDPANSLFHVDPTNTQELGADAVVGALAEAAGTWADETTAGVLPHCWLSDEPLEADWDTPDGVNEVVFGDIDQAGAIAVTIVWGIFGGPPAGRGIMEFDVIFDQADFDWSLDATGSTTEMDLPNIATHELGHALGLGDLYKDACNHVTMYGYSSNGETTKRSLEPDDIAGLVALYGE